MSFNRWDPRVIAPVCPDVQEAAGPGDIESSTTKSEGFETETKQHGHSASMASTDWDAIAMTAGAVDDIDARDEMLANMSQEDLLKEAQRLEQCYMAEMEKQVPDHAKVFEYGSSVIDCGTYLNEVGELLEDVIHLFEELADTGYKQQECLMEMARAEYVMGHFRRSRYCVESCLEMDESYEPALQFQAMLQDRVLSESKFVFYGIAGVFVGVRLWRAYQSAQSKEAAQSLNPAANATA